LQVSFKILTCGNATCDCRRVLSKFDGFLQTLSAKGFRSGKEMDCFEPVGFTLAVVAVEDV
jgi:hypothetical protein